MKEITILDCRFRLFLTQDQIATQVTKLAHAIREDYRDLFPMFLIVLKGAYPFAKDLIQETAIPSSVSFIQLSSFRGLFSGGEIIEKIPLMDEINNRHLIIIEDILESGKTLFETLPMLEKQKPASLKICTLLSKPEMLQYPVQAAYTGFEISNEFVVGYGLDYLERGRELKDIYQLIDQMPQREK